MTLRNSSVQAQSTSLPPWARSSLNHCNLPAVILGSLTFQQYPSLLQIDGALELHRRFFQSLAAVTLPASRAILFMDYMRSGFLLDNLDAAGFEQGKTRFKRDKANYLRLLRGWMFDSDGIEGAVLKRWVESRFGLLPRSHRGALDDVQSPAYAAYVDAFRQGLYNANALEAQLDLLYSYCQYELQRQYPERTHLTLFRGVNQIEAHALRIDTESDGRVLLLNNLNSFSDDPHHADAFGDHVFCARVPQVKLVYFPGLLPGVLQGEAEYLVLGGVYQVQY